MPPSRTVAPYSPPRTQTQPPTVPRHGRHPPPFIPVTNAIEALNRQLRKAIKTKGHFPTEDAARKLIYLAITNAVPA
jgi:transposase-like protein